MVQLRAVPGDIQFAVGMALYNESVHKKTNVQDLAELIRSRKK